MTNWKGALGLIAGAALVYLGATRLDRSAPPVAEAPRTPAVELILPDPDGKTVALSQFKGKVVLVDFFATWCAPCLEELPDLKRLHADYGPKGFAMLGVSMDEEGAEAVKPFIEENEIAYPIVLSGSNPPPGYKVTGIPTAFLISRQGLILRTYFGPKSYRELAADIEKNL